MIHDSSWLDCYHDACDSISNINQWTDIITDVFMTHMLRSQNYRLSMRVTSTERGSGNYNKDAQSAHGCQAQWTLWAHSTQSTHECQAWWALWAHSAQSAHECQAWWACWAT